MYCQCFLEYTQVLNPTVNNLTKKKQVEKCVVILQEK